MTTRPAATLLAALYAGATLLLALACVFPLSPTTPVGLGLALLPVGAGVALALWLTRDRVTDGVLLAAAGLVVVLMGVLLAAATTPAGVVMDATGFGWVVGYVALLLPRHAGPFTAFALVVLVLGVVLNGVPGIWPAVLVIAGTIAMVAAVLVRLSVLVRRSLTTDPLTGVLNRAGLRDALQARRRRDAAVAVLDLDAFKAVNDDLGHLAGDRLLAEAAGAWQGGLRRGDVLARVGGDEFVLVMPETTEQEARAVIGRLRRAHPVAFSAGVALLHDGDAEAAFDRADRELYRVKAKRDRRAAAPVAVAGTA